MFNTGDTPNADTSSASDVLALYGPNYTDGGSLGSSVQHMLPATGITVLDAGPLHLTVGGLVSLGLLAVVVGFMLMATARRTRRTS